ncbi:hypothetical protein [Xanthobacter agilis]|uniref:Uncharacterized protein n=1 Tax=Xanthobacter agilis TaxID=47492 RepID=A0ABU0LDS3_XANAG|nr:hypothetical protein [Xanthobacter agilis]MDQ0505243.1 hypothetical protein [Xanthobacter agilis]
MGLAQTAKFECAWLPAGQKPAAEVAALLAAGDPLDKPQVLNAAVDQLRASGLRPALIIDGLVSAYCPSVAANASYTDAQKVARMQAFAARTVRLVYSLESADKIFLDVALPSSVVDAVNAKASAGGVSQQDWLAGVVTTAAQAK